MDLQSETQNMVDAAITKGYEQLEKFKEVYDQFPKEDKDVLRDLAEEW